MEKNIEYKKMASYYDLLYSKKNYNREVQFIKQFIKNKYTSILDAGCGTGSHAKILKENGFEVSGFDLNEEMIEVAREKCGENFEVCDILNYNSDRKYDIVICFFAVFNHLKSYREFEKALCNLLEVTSDNGVVIIDLHNPQKNGEKTDTIENIEREMKWRVCKLFNIENSKITYIINGERFVTTHKFKIFKIKKMTKLCRKLNLQFHFYENYDINSTATNSSKNIQLVVTRK